MFCQQLLNEPKGAERAGIRVSFLRQAASQARVGPGLAGRTPAATQQLYRFVWNRVFNPGLAGRTPAATQQLYRFVVGPGLQPDPAGRRPAATQQLYKFVLDRVFDPVLRVKDPLPNNSSIGSYGTGSSTPVLRVGDPQPLNSSIGSCGTGSSTPVLRVEHPLPPNSSTGSCGTGSSPRSCGSETRSHSTALQVRVGPGLRPGLAGRRPAATQHLFYRLVWDRVFNPILRAEDPQPHNSSSIGSCGTGSSTRSCGPKTRSHTIIATHSAGPPASLERILLTDSWTEAPLRKTKKAR